MSATWKKVIVSGSQAELAGVSGSFSGSFFGSGNGLTNIPYSAITGAPQGGASGNLIFSGSLTGSFTPDAGGGLTSFKIQSGSTPATLLTVSSSGIVKAGDTFAIGALTASRSTFMQNVYDKTYNIATSNVTINGVNSWSDTDANWEASSLSSWITPDTPLTDILYFLLKPYQHNFQAGQPNLDTYQGTAGTQNGTIAQAATIAYQSQHRVPNGTNPETNIQTFTTLNYHTAGGLYMGNFPAVAERKTISLFDPYWTVASLKNNVNDAQSNTNAFGLGSTAPGTPTTVTDFVVSASVTNKSLTGANFSSQWSATTLYTVQRTDSGVGLDANGLYFNRVPDPLNQFLYQDGYYSGTSFTQNIKFRYNPSANINNIDQAGYYELTASIAIASSSAAGLMSPSNPGTGTADFKIKYFYMPAAIGNYTIPFSSYLPAYTTNTINLIPGSIASSSLSGAPYMSSASYAISESISNAFTPLYANSTTLYTVGSAPSITGAGLSNTLTTTNKPTSFGVNTSTGLIAAPGDQYIYDSTGNTLRTTTDYPTFSDIIKLNYSIKFDASLASGQESNVTSATSVTAPTITQQGPLIVKPNASNQLADYTRVTYLAVDGTGGPFSNILAWRRLKQGQAVRTAATVNASNQVGQETLYDEAYRLQLSDNLLSFNVSSTAWSTAFALNTLGNKDLQVKPGFLVWPGGTRGYWINDPAGGAENFKYYVTYFDTTGTPNGDKSSLSITLGGTGITTAWKETSNSGIAAAVLLESLSSGNSLFTDPVLIDLADTSTGGLWSTNTAGINPTTGVVAANTSGLNPFGTQIRVMRNGGGAFNIGGASTIYLNTSSAGQRINSSIVGQKRYMVIVRFKGDAGFVTSVTGTTVNS